MKVGILGSGDVAKALADGFLEHGYDVTLGTRDGQKLAEWNARNPEARIAGFGAATEFADVIVLAVKGSAAGDVLRAAGVPNLRGKIVIDATNPIADAPPENGVLRFFTDLDRSLMEQLQAEFPDARFVKAFNAVGHARMVNPVFDGGRPTMFICGNDAEAKRSVAHLLDQFGWDAEDMGGAMAARAIEPLCMLWCIPGFCTTTGCTRSSCSSSFARACGWDGYYDRELVPGAKIAYAV